MKKLFRFFAIFAAGAVVASLSACDNHVHSGEWKQTVAPSCGIEGVETRVCDVCGQEETRSVAALEHKWKTVDNKADCTHDGFTGEMCSLCGTKGEGVTTPALKHRWGEWKITKESDCLKNISGERQRICLRCLTPETEVISPEHDWVLTGVTKKATCTEDGLCDSADCNKCHTHEDNHVIPATGHEYADVYSLDKKATETEPGEQSRHCVHDDCNERISIISIPALSAKKDPIDIGDKMYDFTVESIDATEENYKSFYEILSGKKLVIINFYYVNCTYCNEEFPGFVELYNSLGEAKKDVAFIILNTSNDTPEAMKRHRAKYDLPTDWIIADCGNVDSWFKLHAISPSTYLIDSEGILRYQKQNELSKGELGSWLNDYIELP